MRMNAGPVPGRVVCALLGAAVAGALATGEAAGVVTAVQETPDAPEPAVRRIHPEAVEAISRIRSPFCPGLMLEVCPSPDADVLRDSIDARARAGMDADAIIEAVIAAHGEEWRAVPRTTGTGLLAWVMPPAAILLGLGVVVAVLRRMREPEVAGAGAELTVADRARLDAALAEMEAIDEAQLLEDDR